VFLIKMPNGTSNYAVLGSFYTKKSPPPVTDPKLDYCEWEGGHTEKFDANEDAEVFLTQDFKGGVKTTVKKDIDIKTTDGGKMSMVSDGDMLVKSATGNVNVESPTGTVTIKQQTIDLQATTIKLTGHVIVNGAMDQTGVHLDTRGHHTNTAERDAERISKLEAHLAALEARVAQLEARHGS
jgi:phage baseplate assembly protein gpV